MRCKMEKNGETRRKTKKIRRRDKGQKKWGDEMRDEKKMERQEPRQKKMERRDTRQKKWGDEMQGKKNGQSEIQ